MLCGADVYIFSVCGFTARDLGDGRYVFAELALQVGSFVFVYHVFLCQFVDHRNYLREHFASFGLVRGKAEFLYGVARCFMVVTVAQTFLVVGTDTLDRRFMVCHL